MRDQKSLEARLNFNRVSMATRGARARICECACICYLGGWASEAFCFFRKYKVDNKVVLIKRVYLLGQSFWDLFRKKKCGGKKNILESMRGKIQPNCRETFNRTDKENSFCSLQQPLDIQAAKRLEEANQPVR